MLGKLYTISTPSGNLSDFSVRAIEILNEIDYQIAVNQTLTEVIDPKTEFVEIALLPPFAGG